MDDKYIVVDGIGPGPKLSFTHAVCKSDTGLALLWASDRSLALQIATHLNGAQQPVQSATDALQARLQVLSDIGKGNSVYFIPPPPQYIAYNSHSEHGWCIYYLVTQTVVAHNYEKAEAKAQAASMNGKAGAK